MQIVDLHNDILILENFSHLPPFYCENKIVTAIYRGERSFSKIFNLTKKSPFIAFEDVGYDDLDEDKLIEIKPVYVGVTWNGENKFGYGCDYCLGLKEKGVALVKKLTRNSITVDTAHISKAGFIDIVDNAEKVINSHTCFNGVYKHKRNLDDWQIKLIIEKGGIIGLTACGYFMTNEKHCKIDDFIRNILYFSEKFGTDNLCFGTDFFGTDFLPEGMDNDYSGFEIVKELLIKSGFTNAEIENIFYNNANRFLSK